MRPLASLNQDSESVPQAFLGVHRLYIGTAQAARDDDLMRLANIRLAINCTGDQPGPGPNLRSLRVVINNLCDQDLRRRVGRG